MRVWGKKAPGNGQMERAKTMATNDTTKAQEWNTATDGDGSGWGTEVSDESQIVLENEGEGFTATFLEMDETNSGIAQAHFRNVYDLEERGGAYLGELMFLNAGRDLERKLKGIPRNSEVRIQWTTSIDTGQKTPMRKFSVQWR